jgi:hypothetical protein
VAVCGVEWQAYQQFVVDDLGVAALLKFSAFYTRPEDLLAPATREITFDPHGLDNGSLIRRTRES